MPNIPVVSARKLIKVLQKKGFKLHRTQGSHHIYIQSDTQITVSIPVHSGHDLGKGITLSILKDAQITIEEFQKMV